MPGSFKRTEELFPERSLRQILPSRRPVVAVAPADPVARALALMAEHDIGVVLVLDGERLAGILSERDLVRHAGSGPALRDLRVDELMTRDVATVDADAQFRQCMVLMDARGARHLPVVENGRVVAVVSLRDLLHEAVKHQQRVLAEVDRERLAAFQSTA